MNFGIWEVDKVSINVMLMLFIRVKDFKIIVFYLVIWGELFIKNFFNLCEIFIFCIENISWNMLFLNLFVVIKEC